MTLTGEKQDGSKPRGMRAWGTGTTRSVWKGRGGGRRRGNLQQPHV